MTRSTHFAIVGPLALGVMAVAAVAAAEANPGYGRGPKAHQGYARGAVTKKERIIISRQRQRLVHLRRRAFQDGQLTRREAKKISKARRRLHHVTDRALNNDKFHRRPQFRDRWTDRTHDHRWNDRGRYPRWC